MSRGLSALLGGALGRPWGQKVEIAVSLRAESGFSGRTPSNLARERPRESDPRASANWNSLPVLRGSVVSTFAKPRRGEARPRDAWLERVDAFGEMPETEMVEAFWPDGAAPVTVTPRVEVDDGVVRVTCATPGASIGVRHGDGAWKLYTGSFSAPSGTDLTVKAVRYGWDESVEVGVSVP